MNMKRDAGYIEHVLKLEGVTRNMKTSLKPVEGALKGQVVRQRLRTRAEEM